MMLHYERDNSVVGIGVGLYFYLKRMLDCFQLHNVQKST